jgi:hypothetical protein
LRHKEQWFPAAHPPIVERELWDQVHAILATNCRVRGGAIQAVVSFLLKGIVFGADGRALSPWHSTKKSNGRRYRYYIPMRDTKEQAGASGLPRLPAAELESAVLEQLRAILRVPAPLGDLLPQATKLDPTLDEAKVTVATTHLDGVPDVIAASDGRLTLSVPIQIKRRSGRKLATLPNGEADQPRPWDVAATPMQLANACGARSPMFASPCLLSMPASKVPSVSRAGRPPATAVCRSNRP